MIAACLLLHSALLAGANPQARPPGDFFDAEKFPEEPAPEFPEPETGPEDERRGCNLPSFSLDGALTNDNRRSTGIVVAEGDYFPPVQQSLATARLTNIQCRKADGEISMSYSLHDFRVFEEKQFRARGMFEPLPRVRVYGGIAYFDNPDGLFDTRSLFLIGGVEYPSVFGTTVKADYLRDVKENGDWLTVQILKRHRLGALRRGAVFTYEHGFGATGTRQLPGNTKTPEINGIPSVFYRAILEIEDGPVTWYVEASPHVSFVSRATGVRDKHFLLAVGFRITVP